MKNRILFLSVLMGALSITLFNGCKKTEESAPLEPISLVKPDTAITRLFAGDQLPIEIKFTTDRPINYILGKYDIDSLQTTGYVATYPDTLFFEKLDGLDPRVNRYTYTGTYTSPDTLRPFDVIRFRIFFEAGSSVFKTGQNYPAGKVSFSKEFRIDVR
ncbi:MAG: hypothetical protein NTY88_03775 [Bacteroidetes bacterium]|nr:hypothetical protein [Bacteroidota bacterium]